MEPFKVVRSALVPLPAENVDTDQIIPARYLKVTDKQGLGQACFADWRYHEDGTPREAFVLNQPRWQGREILLAGDNFGCGSSREHAPWALRAVGFRAIVSTSFADIFRNNALKNGLLPVAIDAESHRQLFSLVEEEPDSTVTISLEDQSLTLPDGRAIPFEIDPFSRRCLLDGVDQLGYLQRFADQTEEFESRRPAWA